MLAAGESAPALILGLNVGVLGETIGIRPTMFLSASGEIAAVISLLVAPVWSLRELLESMDG